MISFLHNSAKAQRSKIQRITQQATASANPASPREILHSTHSTSAKAKPQNTKNNTTNHSLRESCVCARNITQHAPNLCESEASKHKELTANPQPQRTLRLREKYYTARTQPLRKRSLKTQRINTANPQPQRTLRLCEKSNLANHRQPSRSAALKTIE